MSNSRLLFLLLISFSILLPASPATAGDQAVISQYYLHLEHVSEDVQAAQSAAQTPSVTSAAPLPFPNILAQLQILQSFDRVYNHSLTQHTEQELLQTDIIYCISQPPTADSTAQPEPQLPDTSTPTPLPAVYWDLSGQTLLQSLLAQQKIELLITLADGSNYFTYQLPLAGNTVPLSRRQFSPVSNIGVELTSTDGLSISSLGKQLHTTPAAIKVYALLCTPVAEELAQKLPQYSEYPELLATFSPTDGSLTLSPYPKSR